MADSKTILSAAEEKMDMAIMYLEEQEKPMFVCWTASV